MALFHDAGFADVHDFAGVEDGLAVVGAEGLHGGELFEEFEIDCAEREFGVELDVGDELLGREHGAGGGGKAGAKLVEHLLPDGEPGGHFVSAEFFHEVGALAEGGDEGEPFDAASASFAHAHRVEADDDGGAVMFALEAGGDDADDAGVPLAAADDDGGIGLGGEAVVELRFGFHAHVVFDFAAVAVLLVEQLGEDGGAGGVVGEEEFEGGFGGGEAARCVEPWAEREADVSAVERGLDGGDFDEGAQAGPACLLQPLQARADEGAVFSHERDDVGDGGEGDEVEHAFEVEARDGSSFQQRVGDFERDARAAQVAEVFAADFRIHERHDGRERVFGLVVVEDDGVDALLAKAGDFCNGGGAAIDGDEQPWGVDGDAAGDAVCREPVAFIHAVGQKRRHFPAGSSEHSHEDGERSDAVHIVVAVERDALFRLQRGDDAGDCGIHPRHEKGIAERAQERAEKLARIRSRAHSPPEHHLRDPRRDARFRCQLGSASSVDRRRQGPAHLAGKLAMEPVGVVDKLHGHRIGKAARKVQAYTLTETLNKAGTKF